MCPPPSPLVWALFPGPERQGAAFGHASWFPSCWLQEIGAVGAIRFHGITFSGQTKGTQAGRATVCRQGNI